MGNPPPPLWSIFPPIVEGFSSRFHLCLFYGFSRVFVWSSTTISLTSSMPDLIVGMLLQYMPIESGSACACVSILIVLGHLCILWWNLCNAFGLLKWNCLLQKKKKLFGHDQFVKYLKVTIQTNEKYKSTPKREVDWTPQTSSSFFFLRDYCCNVSKSVPFALSISWENNAVTFQYCDLWPIIPS